MSKRNHEFFDRVLVNRAILNSPDSALNNLARATNQSLKEVIHYEKPPFGVVASMFVLGADGLPYRIIGANYKPEKGNYVNRVCGELAMLAAAEEGDLFTNFLVVRGPTKERLRSIEGVYSEMNAIQLCKPCRTLFAGIFGEDFRTASYTGKDLMPTESMTVGEQIELNERSGLYLPVKSELEIRHLARASFREFLAPISQIPKRELGHALEFQLAA